MKTTISRWLDGLQLLIHKLRAIYLRDKLIKPKKTAMKFSSPFTVGRKKRQMILDD